MTSLQIQEMITTTQWGMWLRYIKKHSVKNEGGQWPNSEFHDFYVSLGVTETEGEATCERGSDSKGSESVVRADVPEGHDSGTQIELLPYDHVPQRRTSHEELAALQQHSDGFADSGPISESETSL